MLQDYDGVVEQIGFRSTRLRTADGLLVTIPHRVFTSLCVENTGRRPAFRHEIHLALGSDTAARKIESALAAVRSIFEESEISDTIHPPAGGVETPPQVFSDNIAPNAFKITAVYWFGIPDYWEYIEHREKVKFRILKAFEELDIKFATSDEVVHLVSGGTSSPSSSRPMPQ